MNPGETRVLLVDDDPFVRDMVGFILQASDYVVETAENGRDALEKIIENPGFHLVITDMNMPEMDGLSLIREIRKTDPDTAIIVMTGSDDGGPPSGADDCVTKDENIQETIVASVEAVFQRRGLKD